MAQIDDKQLAKLASLVVALQQLVDSLSGPSVVVSAAIRERIAKYRESGTCLYCNKSLYGQVRRGCHQVCYAKVKRKLDRNLMTLQQVVDKGWMNPVAEQPGPKSGLPDPMRAELFDAPTVAIESAEASALAGDIIAGAKKPKPKRVKK